MPNTLGVAHIDLQVNEPTYKTNFKKNLFDVGSMAQLKKKINNELNIPSSKAASKKKIIQYYSSVMAAPP